MGVRGLWGLCIGVVLSVSACASTQDPAYDAAIARAEATCQQEDCACERTCHVDIIGCPFSEAVCETGLERCLRTCSGEGISAALTR